jgi:hypothetical protein
VAADIPDVRVPIEKSAALETLGVCAEFRAWGGRGCHAFYAAVRRLTAQAAEKLPAPPIVILIAIAGAVCSARTFDQAAGLSKEEYRRRYELGRLRYQEERTARKARRQSWLREHGPWLLLAVVAAVLILFLGVAQPHGPIILITLALYTGLTWVVCWAVRASC